MKDDELHISSLLVHVNPKKAAAITASINLLSGAQVITISPEGKAIVLLEAGHQRIIMQVIDNINALEGVINTGLVYHEFEKLTQQKSEGVK